LSLRRSLTFSAVTAGTIAAALFLSSAPAQADPANANSTSPGTLLVGDSADAQITYTIPSTGDPTNLPSAVSFSAAPVSGNGPSALSFAITATTANLSGCSTSADGTSGSCSWTDAKPGDTAVVTVHETGVERTTGLQHLTFSQTMGNGANALACTEDMTVIDRPVIGTASVSSPSVAIGGTVSVTATFTIAPGTPSQYLPSFVEFFTATDPASGASSLSFALTSFTGASSCQVTPDTKGIGCQLANPQAGSTITVTGVATATTKQLGDSGTSPLGIHHVYLAYGGPSLLAIPETVADPVIDVTAAPVASGSGPSSPTSASGGSQPAASSDPTVPSTELAATGSDVWPMAAGASILLVGGAFLLVVRPRRRKARA